MEGVGGSRYVEEMGRIYISSSSVLCLLDPQAISLVTYSYAQSVLNATKIFVNLRHVGEEQEEQYKTMREQPQNEEKILNNMGKTLWGSGYQMLAVQRSSYCAIHITLKH